ncbi:hypothetical protein LshimejAT787_1801830 [Lyophyllum shimeji]|uniref:Uncharacterized protein n=1 Tax=Lyophyllum shimeji TaxID=47721 RepID=A0A9P3UW77_LYOSH|nr:hypothetical protein LshimejAT787_1801830 [Lyophyllum shimeji]
MISSNFVFHCRPAYFKPSGSSETHSKVPVFCSTSYSVTIAFSHCFEHVDFIASACSFVVRGQAVTLDGGANTCGVVSWRQIGPLRWFRASAESGCRPSFVGAVPLVSITARSPGLSSSTKPDSPSLHQSTSRLPNPSIALYDAPERCNAQR